MKRGSPLPTGYYKKWKKEPGEQIEESERKSKTVNEETESIKKFVRDVDLYFQAKESIQIVDEKFGVQNCLDKIVGGRYVLGSDGDFEFKLKYVLSHLEKMPQTALDEILEFFTRSYDADKNPKYTARILYLMYGPVMKITIRSGCRIGNWIMWDEPMDFLEVNEDFKALAEKVSMLHSIGGLDFDMMEMLFTKTGPNQDKWSDSSIAMVLFFMSNESRNWYLKKKQNCSIIESVSEVPGILAHLLFTASHLEVEANNLYNTVTRCVSNISSDGKFKETFLKSIWHELVNHLRDVNNLNPRFKRIAMKAISEFGKFLMNKAYNNDSEDEMETEE